MRPISFSWSSAASHMHIRRPPWLGRHSSTVAKLTGQAAKQLEPSCKDVVVNLGRDPRKVLNVLTEQRVQHRRQLRRVEALACLAQGLRLFHDLIDGVQKQARGRALGAPYAPAKVLASTAVAPATMTRLRRTHGKASLDSINDWVVG